LVLGSLPAMASPVMALNPDLPPAEQYRRLSLALLVGEGVEPQMYAALMRRVEDLADPPELDPDRLKSPLYRIVDQESMLTGSAFLFKLAQVHRTELATRLEALQAEAEGVSSLALKEDAILVRNAIAESLEADGLAGEPGVEQGIQTYRERTLALRNLLEYDSFDRELDRIPQAAIAAVGGKLDAYRRMFDDELRDDAFEQHVRSAEYPYLGRQPFNEDAARLAEEIMDGVVLSESQPDL
jgi:hypothetical protein